jgi:hypothetical protein
MAPFRFLGNFRHSLKSPVAKTSFEQSHPLRFLNLKRPFKCQTHFHREFD